MDGGLDGLLLFLDEMRALRDVQADADELPREFLEKAKQSLASLNHGSLVEILGLGTENISLVDAGVAMTATHQHEKQLELIVRLLQMMSDDGYELLLPEVVAMLACIVFITLMHLPDNHVWQLLIEELFGVLETGQSQLELNDLYPVLIPLYRAYSLKTEHTLVVSSIDGLLLLLRGIYDAFNQLAIQSSLPSVMLLYLANLASNTTKSINDSILSASRIGLLSSCLDSLELALTSSSDVIGIYLDATFRAAACVSIADNHLYQQQKDNNTNKIQLMLAKCYGTIGNILQNVILYDEEYSLFANYKERVESLLLTQQSAPFETISACIDFYIVSLSQLPPQKLNLSRVLDRMLHRYASTSTCHTQLEDLFCILLALEPIESETIVTESDISITSINNNINPPISRKRRHSDESSNHNFCILFDITSLSKKRRKTSLLDDDDNSQQSTSENSKYTVHTACPLLAHVYQRMTLKHTEFMADATALNEERLLDFALDFRLLLAGCSAKGESHHLTALFEHLLMHIVQLTEFQDETRYLLEIAYSLNELYISFGAEPSEQIEQTFAAITPSLQLTKVLCSNDDVSMTNVDEINPTDACRTAAAQDRALSLVMSSPQLFLPKDSSKVHLDLNVCEEIAMRNYHERNDGMHESNLSLILTNVNRSPGHIPYQFLEQIDQHIHSKEMMASVFDYFLVRLMSSSRDNLPLPMRTLRYYVDYYLSKWQSFSDVEKAFLVNILKHMAHTSLETSSLTIREISVMNIISSELRLLIGNISHHISIDEMQVPPQNSKEVQAKLSYLAVLTQSGQVIPRQLANEAIIALLQYWTSNMPRQIHQTLHYQGLLHLYCTGSPRLLLGALEKDSERTYLLVQALACNDVNNLEDTAQVVNVRKQVLAEQLISNILPVAVHKKDAETLNQLNKDAATPLTRLAVTSMHEILCFLLISKRMWSAPDAIVPLIQRSLPEMSGQALGSLVRSCLLDLIVALIIQSKDEQMSEGNPVFESIRLVAKLSGHVSTDAAGISSFLSEHFLGVLVSLNKIGLNNDIESATRIGAVRCLRQLVRLTSGHLQLVLPQVISMMQTYMGDIVLYEEALGVWRELIDVMSPQVLTKHAQVILIIVAKAGQQHQHFSKHEAIITADSIICAIIMRETPSLHSALNSMPDIIALKHYPAAHKYFLELRSTLSEAAKFQLALEATQAEEPHIVLNALEAMLVVIPATVSDDHSTSLPLSKIYRTALQVLKRFGDQDFAIVEACAQILGCLWFVDIEHDELIFGRAADMGRTNDFLSLEIEENLPLFAVWLLETVLIKAFKRMRSPRDVSAVSFVIQEMLKRCDVTLDTIRNASMLTTATSELHTPAHTLWKSLSEDTREICAPLLTSKYYIASTNRERGAHPVFVHEQSYRAWITQWCLRLMSFDFPQRTQNLLRILMPAVTIEIQVPLALIPLVIVHCLLLCPASCHSELHEEIMAVLQYEDSDSAAVPLKMIFSILDSLNTLRILAPLQNNVRRVLDDFFDNLPKQLLSKASRQAQDYNRAVLFLESYIRSQRSKKVSDELLEDMYRQLFELYALAGSADEATGVSALVCNKSVKQEILEHELCGRWVQAQTVHEQYLSDSTTALEHHLGIIQCLQNLGHYETARSHILTLQSTGAVWNTNLQEHAIEASWCLGNWDEMEQLQANCTLNSPSVLIGRTLTAMRRGDHDLAAQCMVQARTALVLPLAAAPAFHNAGYMDMLVQLRQIHEASTSLRLVTNALSANTNIGIYVAVNTLCDKLYEQPILRPKKAEALLSFRRSLLSLISENTTAQDIKEFCQTRISNLWLLSAHHARKRADHVGVYRCALKTNTADALSSKLIFCKSLWDRGEGQLAIGQLDGFVRYIRTESEVNTPPSLFELASSGFAPLDRTTLSFKSAQANLTLTRWIEQLRFEDSNSVIQRYRQICAMQPRWDKGFFFLGRFYTLLYNSSQSVAQLSTSSQINTLRLACKCLGKSLLLGPKYTEQALPKLLTLWLNATMLTSDREADSDTSDINRIVKNLSDMLPPYMWMVSLSQITSRISHPNVAVYAILEKILTDVVIAYPAQSLWRLACVHKSPDYERSKRCSNVLTIAKEFMSLTHELTKLSRLDVTNKNMLSLKHDARTLSKMAQTSIIIPTITNLSLTLPALPRVHENLAIFPENAPTISELENEVTVMPSLVAPKKLTIIGSDGKRYVFLCKPQDDLRKDGRLIEFTTMINKLLMKDEESRNRRLRIRTFSVIPLSQASGIIEWVPHTACYRVLLTECYKRNGVLFDKETSKWIGVRFKRPEKELESIFRNELLGRFKPVFHDWFLNTFPDPNAWHAARATFTRTCAVMSMVGTILGLGDRHGENLLVDVRNGDVVHVDFNCLFEKGMTFHVPERVPFRLTQNMVDGFGLTGYEGTFRKACEVSLRVLREHKEVLLTVLETFLHDPLCEWDKHKGKKTAIEGQPSMAQTAKKMLDRCEHKLSGWVGAGLPLGVEGQVQKLIREATDAKNLARMYIGWAPYL